MRRLLTTSRRSLAFARSENWFVSKIPPLLAIGYLASVVVNVAPQECVRLLGAGLFSIFCVATYGHIVNDFFDLEADLLAGKLNRLVGIRPPVRWLLLGLFLGAGYLPALTGTYGRAGVLLLTVNYLWPTIYSIPLTRLKEKGLFGVACDALGSHVTPTMFMLALFMPPTLSLAQAGIALAAIIWATVLGIKGILHHQILDRDNDLQAGTVTFSTSMSVARLQHVLTRYYLLVELPVSAVFSLAIFAWCPLAVLGFLIYTGSETLKYRLGFQFALSPNPATIRSSVPFINEMFYVLWMPLAAVIQLAIHDPGLAWLAPLHLAIFHQPVRCQLDDWAAILKNVRLTYRGRRS